MKHNISMTDLVEDANERAMNACVEKEIPDFFTTDDIKNKEYLCNEWVQRWRLIDTEGRLKDIREENYKLQQEARDLREAIKIIVKSFSL